MATKTTPKDVFLHLLATVTLYASVVSFITVLFQYVNKLYPDPLAYGDGGVISSLRIAASVLVVAYPVYVFLNWLIHKEFLHDPSRRELWVHKWLVYLTLFLSAVTVIVDVITLVYNLFGGEVTIKFFLKILAVLITAVAVFGYYYFDLKGDKVSKNLKMLAWVVSIIVLASVVGGFFLIGSPAHQQKINFDTRRLNDLQNIQSQIVNYYQSKGTIPADLNQLKDNISGYMPPVDPVTGAPYEYRGLSNLSFQLCATFDLPNPANIQYPRTEPVVPSDINASTWDHGPGLVCFDRNIDPQKYPVYPKSIPPVPVK